VRIILTGGGTAGHITPNIALVPELKKAGFEVHYIGTKEGMERQLIEPLGIPYHTIHAGKLRRYLDFKNITDLFKIIGGFAEALAILAKVKPKVIFSKGGFVSSPVVWAAWVHRIPALIHESDITPGLANKLSIPFATKICYTFPETKHYLPSAKGILTGLPVRESLLRGDAVKGRRICGFNDNKPVLMVIGGSQGSEILNKAIRSILGQVMEKFNLCHLCGKNGVDPVLDQYSGYKQFDYVNEDLPHLLALTDLVISRAGATTLFELLAIKKPHLLIPLSKQASRGDQILNARSFEKQGFSKVLPEEDLNPEALLNTIFSLYESRDKYIMAMNASQAGNGVQGVISIIKDLANYKSSKGNQ
jgi:UDP-N-acetylglucosamine--N-acetylmuramyl-(pentapeptide) pyrophosphoryl-undecaprenol N-acetylglucosamine transferase